MYASVLAAGESVSFPITAGRYAWVQCVSGEADVNGLAVKAGDGVAVSDEASLLLRGTGSAGGELLLFDLA
jgi:redox-sensitive bicupin YhaK (pirin superfamily)